MRCYSPNCITCDLGEFTSFSPKRSIKCGILNCHEAPNKQTKILQCYVYVPWEMCHQGSICCDFYLQPFRGLQAKIENAFFLQVITAEVAQMMFRVCLRFHKGGVRNWNKQIAIVVPYLGACLCSIASPILVSHISVPSDLMSSDALLDSATLACELFLCSSPTLVVSRSSAHQPSSAGECKRRFRGSERMKISYILGLISSAFP